MAPSGKKPKIAASVAINITITAKKIQTTVMTMPQGRGCGASVISTVMGVSVAMFEGSERPADQVVERDRPPPWTRK